METTIEAYKLEAADKYEKGFEAGIEQAKVIAPDVDFSKADAWKEIVDGRIVSPRPNHVLNSHIEDLSSLAINSVLDDGDVENNSTTLSAKKTPASTTDPVSNPTEENALNDVLFICNSPF